MQKDTNNQVNKVIEKIENASNILVAVSKNPTIDELSAALGLTMMLDGMGKHATAIYSGEVPGALKFLEPEKTFEADTNSLQDFIIALAKEKADHLRYKIDGDMVKVFITPYRTTIDESDLEFSHGAFNIDLLIALGVPEVEDLDAALYEHGKILHEAEAISVSNDEPAKFGEVQWTDPAASSVSEMVTGLAFALRDKAKMSEEVATALLTGIIANTARFMNNKTTPKTMDVASRLMQAGANQQEISANLEGAISDGGLEVVQGSEAAPAATSTAVLGELNIEKSPEAELEQMVAAPAGGAGGSAGASGTSAIDELAKESAAMGNAAEAATSAASIAPTVPTVPTENIYPKVESGVPMGGAEAVVAPEAVPESQMPKDYGQMMEEALSEPLPNPAAQAAPAAPTGPEMNHIPEMEYVPHAATTPVTVPTMGNEFLTSDGSGVPLPPPPVPPISSVDVPTETPIPAAPTEAPIPAVPMDAVAGVPPVAPVPPASPVVPAASVVPASPVVPPAPAVPVAPDQTVSQLEQSNDPGAFKIPGM